MNLPNGVRSQERDLQLYKLKENEREEFEKSRWKPVEGFIREVELEG